MGGINQTEEIRPFRILVLDGGGSKGIYTLGILNELELKLGSTLDNWSINRTRETYKRS